MQHGHGGHGGHGQHSQHGPHGQHSHGDFDEFYAGGHRWSGNPNEALIREVADLTPRPSR